MDDRALGRLAGSVVMCGFRGLDAGPGTEVRAQIRELGLGGVLLFDRDVTTGAGGRNVASPAQVRALCAELREAAGERGIRIAVDQEGGAVARLHPGNGFPAFPSHAELGRGGDPEATRRAAGAIAGTLASCGVTINFAPVVDLDRDPPSPALGARGRCFAREAGAVAAHARAFVEAHAACGVACALKHFPGHGSAAGDTHAGPVDITESHEDAEIEPYRILLAEGGAPLVMVGHLLHRRVDPERPASLSRAWIGGVLRGDLAFRGAVVTDDLDMGAVGRIPLEERVALALEAGVDLLLFGNNLAFDPELPARVVDAVVRAVRSGRLSEAELRTRAERIERACAARSEGRRTSGER